MKKLLIVFFCLVGFFVEAQPPSKFYTRIGGNGYDYGYDIKQTLDGGYIITGSTSSFGKGNTDVYLLKIDSMGQVNFQTSFGGYNNESGKAVVQLVDSSYVIAGYTSSLGFGGYDIYVIKADKTGALIWQKTFGQAEWDFCNTMQATADGGFILAGSTNSFGYGQADGYVIKIDANGTEQWHKNFGGLENDEFKSVIQTADGGYLLAGQTKSYNDLNGDAWLFKLDVNGDSLWSKYYGGTKEDYATQIIEHSNGDLFFSGATQSFGVGKFDGYVVRTSNNGNLIIQSTDGFAGTDDYFYSITISKRNPNIITVLENEIFSGFKLQTKILEINENLSYLNATEYGSTLNDELYKIFPTTDKGYVMTGYTEGYDAMLADCYIVKCDSTLLGLQSMVSVNEFAINEFDLKLYPNPVKNKLMIVLNNDIAIKEISVSDVYGKNYNLDKKHFDNKIEINTTDLAEGIYFIRINNVVRKIIKN